MSPCEKNKRSNSSEWPKIWIFQEERSFISFLWCKTSEEKQIQISFYLTVCHSLWGKTLDWHKLGRTLVNLEVTFICSAGQCSSFSVVLWSFKSNANGLNSRALRTACSVWKQNQPNLVAKWNSARKLFSSGRREYSSSYWIINTQHEKKTSGWSLKQSQGWWKVMYLGKWSDLTVWNIAARVRTFVSPPQGQWTEWADLFLIRSTTWHLSKPMSTPTWKQTQAEISEKPCWAVKLLWLKFIPSGILTQK